MVGENTYVKNVKVWEFANMIRRNINVRYAMVYLYANMGDEDGHVNVATAHQSVIMEGTNTFVKNVKDPQFATMVSCGTGVPIVMGPVYVNPGETPTTRDAER